MTALGAIHPRSASITSLDEQQAIDRIIKVVVIDRFHCISIEDENMSISIGGAISAVSLKFSSCRSAVAGLFVHFSIL